MKAHKLQVKIFAEPGSTVTPEMLIPVYHEWIKNRVLPELMIDVANYVHVPHGPGVVLMGHASDYFMDQAEGRLGLLHNQKRLPASAGATTSDVLVGAFRRALHAAILLEREPSLAGKLRFVPNEFLFRVNDRLAAPNDEETFAALEPELGALAGVLFAGSFAIGRVGAAKDLLGARVVTSTQADLSTLLARLGGPPPPL